MHADFTHCMLCNFACFVHWRIQRGGGGAGGLDPPVRNTKKVFFSNPGLDLLKHHKGTKPAFNVGPSSARQRNAIEMAFRMAFR